MFNIIQTPLARTDAYKLSHWRQYPVGTTGIYSNFTPRKSRRPGIDKFVFFGLQAFLYDLEEQFEQYFFRYRTNEAVELYDSFHTEFFGSPSPFNNEQVRALHQLGYLPIKIKALPEGSVVPHNVPVLTIESTDDQLFWFTQWLETWMSNSLWKACTSATTAWYYRKIFNKYNKLTSDTSWLPDFQGHDFSMRGMSCIEDACVSGGAHLISFKGSDTLPALEWIKNYYTNDDDDTELICISVAATEHSVATAFLPENTTNTDESDTAYIANVLQLYPEGIVSVVCDTYDFWHFVTEIVPKFKAQIMSRNGKLVLRPDSSPKTPVEIIIGETYKYLIADWDQPEPPSLATIRYYATEMLHDEVAYSTPHGERGPDDYTNIYQYDGHYYSATIKLGWNRHDKQYYYIDETTLTDFHEVELTPEQKGLVQCLYEIFGGTINSKGYVDLDSHIGAIYGDSITLEYCEAILKGLAAKGFSSDNIVLGIGSMSYQLVTRDTHGIAIKCTAVASGTGDAKHWRATYKDPATDNSGKKSARGWLRVDMIDGNYTLTQDVTQSEADGGALELVYLNGEMIRTTTFSEVRSTLAKFN